MYMTAGKTLLKIRDIQSVPPGSHPCTVLVPNGPHLYPFRHPLLHGTASLLLLRLFNVVYRCAQYYITCGLVGHICCRLHKSLAHECVCSVWALVHRSSVWRSPVCMAARPLWEVRQKGPKLKTSFQPRKTSPTCFFSPPPPEDIIPSRLLQLKIKE